MTDTEYGHGVWCGASKNGCSLAVARLELIPLTLELVGLVGAVTLVFLVTGVVLPLLAAPRASP